MKLKMIKKTFAIFLLSTSLLFAKSNGGTVVGNGAGIVENNFRYGYFLLKEVIPSCTENQMCQLSDFEINLLNKIVDIITSNLLKEDNLIFVSEKKEPGFFTTGEGNEPHRIAKTGLSPDQPIFINLDLLYNDRNEANLDLPAIVGILVHELGHQTGIKNHAALDFLAAKIRFFLTSKINNYKFYVNNDPKLTANVLVINSEFPIKKAHLFISWNQGEMKDITSEFVNLIKCKSNNATNLGFEIQNGNFSKESNSNIVTFNAWVGSYCSIENSADILHVENQDLRLQFDVPALNILELNIE